MTYVTVYRSGIPDSPVIQEIEKAVEATLRNHKIPARAIDFKPPPSFYANSTLIEIQMDTVTTEGVTNLVASELTERIGCKDVYVQIVYPQGKLYKNGTPFPSPKG
ncbi:MAG: hypothetical protein WC521_02015 [Bdellovibrionales bacterium]